MSNSNYIFGSTKEEILGDAPRFFYGLRRTDEGELYFARVDQLSRVDSIQINNEGPVEEDYTQFEIGEDFFEGRDVLHNLVYGNLKYEQYRWDNRSLYYYIDNDGNLVLRISAKYPYPSGI